ncbi:MAG: Anthranilate synthase component 1 [candidate division BRC1 bacterium ADurb.BinA292]|nr:MAG: Anthranilate synthase component 1 [candidate division BRC1 bacterium ADurb.BinA292]
MIRSGTRFVQSLRSAANSNDNSLDPARGRVQSFDGLHVAGAEDAPHPRPVKDRMLKVSPDFETFLQRSREANLIPVWAERLADMETPVSVFRKLADSEHAFLLESVEQGENVGRYSFIGCNPEIIIRCRGHEIDIRYHGDEQPLEQSQPPLEFLREFMQRYRPAADPQLPPFIGGAVGYMAYDLVRHFEKLPDANPDDLKLPDAYFMISDKLAIFDHVRHRMILLANAHVTDDPRRAYDAAIHKIELMAERLRIEKGERNQPVDADISPAVESPVSELVSNFSQDEFMAAVERVKEYIRAGDVFQVVLSQRFSKPYHGDPFDIYRALRAINPSPYNFYLQLGDLKLAGSSPEILVQVNHGEVIVRPIAGTRPRGATPAEDRQHEQDLLADPKELAEHIMLVDLGRNDVGRVGCPGSVHVDDLMAIERYSHVMHIVSNVRGRLRPTSDAFDALAATFPAGTVSGAPKIRAMEIIDELENVRRGPYAGCVGYISFDGNLDTCITIRTAVIKGRRVYIQAGAGIVADSVPATEYQETVNKARAMLRAVEMAEAGLD